MGSSESKMQVSAPVKPEPALKNVAVSHLRDPRSPSAGVDRTPIQVGYRVDVLPDILECPLAFTDPRSPTVGISRTPVREVMRGNYWVNDDLQLLLFSPIKMTSDTVFLPLVPTAKVGSFAQRLGMLFHNETEGKVIEAPQKRFSMEGRSPLQILKETNSPRDRRSQVMCMSKHSLLYSRNQFASTLARRNGDVSNDLMLFCRPHFPDEAEGVHPRKAEAWTDRPKSADSGSGQGEPMRHHSNVQIPATFISLKNLLLCVQFS
uniref:Uncharacterized protein n=1 Tax=Scophthalmus maximus TaxID=52904 RepID=A0A8D3DPX6_SCOMX